MGVPAGKAEKCEDIGQAMIREFFEETGMSISPNKIIYFSKVFVRYPDYDFIYHIFSTSLDEKMNVRIDPKEHKEYRWITPKNALSLPLIQDLDNCIKLFYKV